MHCNDAPGAIARLDDMALRRFDFLVRHSFLRATPHAPHLFALPRAGDLSAQMFEDLGIDPAIFSGCNFTAVVAVTVAKIPVTPAAWHH